VSKERLEEIEREIERSNNATLKGNSLGAERMILDLHEIGRFEWLVKHAKEQAERVQEFKRFSISKDELKEVLNSNENIGELYQFVEGEHSIRDVFAIIVKEMDYLAGALGEYSESYFDLEQQNKRYREALEFYADEKNYDYKINTDSVGDMHDMSYMEIHDVESKIMYDCGEKATKALDENE